MRSPGGAGRAGVTTGFAGAGFLARGWARRDGAFLAGFPARLALFLRAAGFRAGAFLRFTFAFFLVAMAAPGGVARLIVGGPYQVGNGPRDC